MTKFEACRVSKIAQYRAAGSAGPDFVARALSSLIRSARTNKSAAALREIAAQWAVTDHPDFIC